MPGTAQPKRLSRRARWLGGIAALLVLSVSVCAGLVLTGPSIPERVPPVFDVAEVRALAGPEGPVELRAVEVAAGLQYHALLTVGAPWVERKTPVFTVELVWPDGTSALLEPATDAECAEAFLPTHAFDPAAYERMQEAMLRAENIVATHEHFDHLCGLARSPHLGTLAPKVRMPPGQLDGVAMMSVADEGLRGVVTPLVFEGVHRLAPGVVLIAAPGHTPGSLWIYIRELGGTEWLLVGDSVWSLAAITELAPKPWLPVLVSGEDAEADAGYVRFLHDLRRDHPEIRVMVAHEGAQWEQALEEGALTPL